MSVQMNTTTGKRAVYRPSTSASYHISSGTAIPQDPSAMVRYSELTAISVQLDWDGVIPSLTILSNIDHPFSQAGVMPRRPTLLHPPCPNYRGWRLTHST